MIFYFSATGNSLYAAKALAKDSNNTVISITEALKKQNYTYSLKNNESVGFVFPIYYWGLPTIVSDFIKKLNLKNYNNAYTYAVITCGANIGDAVKVFKKRLNNAGYNLDSSFSLAMPDNYILMYDVISKDKQIKMIEAADQELSKINQFIGSKEKMFNVRKGFFPALQTYGINLFYRYGRKTKKFHATDECTSCGLCEKICPLSTIHLENGKPKWDKDCTQCLGCINRCPVKAIQYGKGTYKRGRYVNPSVKF